MIQSTRHLNQHTSHKLVQALGMRARGCAEPFCELREYERIDAFSDGAHMQAILRKVNGFHDGDGNVQDVSAGQEKWHAGLVNALSFKTQSGGKSSKGTFIAEVALLANVPDDAEEVWVAVVGLPDTVDSDAAFGNVQCMHVSGKDKDPV